MCIFYLLNMCKKQYLNLHAKVKERRKEEKERKNREKKRKWLNYFLYVFKVGVINTILLFNLSNILVDCFLYATLNIQLERL